MSACELSPFRRRGKIQSDDGVVLVAALWALVLLSVITGGLMELVRSERRITSHIAVEADAQALAEAGISRGIAILADRGRTIRWPLDGTPQPITYEGQRIEISIQDEFGRIDLNTADEGLLKGLFVSIGIRDTDAEVLVDCIVDWRDADDLKRLHGAERADYRERGQRAEPRNAAFESVDELGQVQGMTPQLLDRVRPALTVYSRRTTVDTATAPAAVLRALPGIDDSQVRLMLAERESMRRRMDNRAGSASWTTADIQELAGRAFLLVARPEARLGRTFHRTTIVRFTGDPARPYWVHEWQ